jgi:hypothetical protein
MWQRITIRFGFENPPYQFTFDYDLEQIPSEALGDHPPENPAIRDLKIYYDPERQFCFAGYNFESWRWYDAIPKGQEQDYARCFGKELSPDFLSVITKSKSARRVRTIAEAVNAMLIHDEHRRKWKAISLLKLIDRLMQEPEWSHFISNDDIRLHCHNKTGRQSREILLKRSENAIKDTVLETREMIRHYHLPIELEQVAHRGVVVKLRATTEEAHPKT